jgi:hypothetical protein
MDEPTDMIERLVRLESWASYERERTDYHLADLSRRLLVLETASSIPLGSAIKLALAIMLPLAVLLATGDLKAFFRLLSSG